jgi:hypothetical protein
MLLLHEKMLQDKHEEGDEAAADLDKLQDEAA